MDIKQNNQKKDRQPRSVISGSPKKGGAGGKGTWGVGGWDDLKTVRTDENDPNYNSDDENLVFQKTDIVSPVDSVIREYFEGGEPEDVVRGLGAIGDAHSYFVKKALVLAMDRQAYEREMVSKLLSKLYNAPFTSQVIQDGFQEALDSLPDISLDVPEAPELLAKFIARAILDEVVPPIFLKNAKIENPAAESTLNLAHALSNDNFRSEKLAHVWGPGAETSVKRLKEEVRTVFREFLTSRDTNEAVKSIGELNATHFHFHVIRIGIQMALTHNEEERKAMLSLIKSLKDVGLVSESNFVRGAKICAQSVEDLKLDAPNAPELLKEIFEQGKKDNWLPSDFVAE